MEKQGVMRAAGRVRRRGSRRSLALTCLVWFQVSRSFVSHRNCTQVTQKVDIVKHVRTKKTGWTHLKVGQM